MPDFLRFPLGGDMLVNTAHIVSVQLDERIAEQKDVDRAGNLFEVGQVMYLVRLTMTGSCNEIYLQYPLEANRTAVYEKIAAALKPVVIVPPALRRPPPSRPRRAASPPPASPASRGRSPQQ